MASQRTYPPTYPLRNMALFFGRVNHWFPLKPAGYLKKTYFLGVGYVRAGGWVGWPVLKKCQGRKFCKFAHGMEELQSAPDLRTDRNRQKIEVFFWENGRVRNEKRARNGSLRYIWSYPYVYMYIWGLYKTIKDPYLLSSIMENKSLFFRGGEQWTRVVSLTV